jgi:hypothetical protein
VPKPKGDMSILASLQFELLNGRPYEKTSDDILFKVLQSMADNYVKRHASWRKQLSSTVLGTWIRKGRTQKVHIF